VVAPVEQVVLERVVLLQGQTVEQVQRHILHKTLAGAAVELLVKMELDYQVLPQQLVLTVTAVQVIMVQVERVV
jgi:hypothetical protein